jgi:p38 MAP kinase
MFTNLSVAFADFHQVGDTSTPAGVIPEGALAGPDAPAGTTSAK